MFAVAALLVLVLVGSGMVVRMLRRRSRHSASGAGTPHSSGLGASPMPLAQAGELERAAVARRLGRDAPARRRLLEGEDPRTGVLRAWLDVQDAAARSGLARRGSETSGEFAARVLGRWDVDPAALATLSSAYREAQFSDHPVSEGARARVVGALQRVEQAVGAAAGKDGAR